MNDVLNTWSRCKLRSLLCVLHLVLCSHIGSYQAPQAFGQPPIEYRLTDVQGQSWNAEFVSLDASTLTTRKQNSESQKSAEEILSIERATKSSRSPESTDTTPRGMQIGLVDGSLLVIQSIQGKEKRWDVQLDESVTWKDFGGEISYLRTRSLDSKGEESWKSLLADNRNADALIVIRPGGALDRVDGIVKEIQAGKVKFDVDGQIVDASMEKLAGVVWYRKGTQIPKSPFRVKLTNGSVLLADALKNTSPNGLSIEGAWGTQSVVPQDWLDAIDCGAGKLAWVSSSETLDANAKPRTRFGELDAAISQISRPRWLSNPSGGEDLLFPNPGEFVFRAPEGMSKLLARIERTNESDLQSPIKLEIWVDDRIAFQKELSSQEATAEVEAPISAGKKTRIVLSSKGALQIGTRAVLRQPRLTK